MKIITLLLSVFLCISVSNAQKKQYVNQKSTRIEKIINSQWTFNYFSDEAADKGYEAPGFDDSRWPAISLPHTWNSYETTGELHPYNMNAPESVNSFWWTGWGWYRKHFSINGDYSAKKIFIKFEGVQKYCKAWLNGKYLGDHIDGHGSFGFDITGYLNPGEDNLLAVAVNNKQDDKLRILPASDGNFFVYGGISNNVTLVLNEKLYIPMQGAGSHESGTLITTPQVSEKEAIVRVQTWIKNDNREKRSCTLKTTIADATNKIVQVIKSSAVIVPGQLYKFDQTGKPIKNPHLWSKEDPYLYKVITEVIDQKEVVDTYTSPHGLKFAMAGDTADSLSENQVLITLEEVINKNANKNPANTSNLITAGDPAKIVLGCSSQKIIADRGSVAVITADMVDSKGNHVNGDNTTIKWTVTGPATLIGPSLYESDFSKHQQMGNAWYSGMPVSNAIRSTGKPGKIRIIVSASGMASGSYDIEAGEKQPDNSVVSEPLLADEGRKPVTGIILKINTLEELPGEMKMTNDDLTYSISGKPAYSRFIKDYILKHNPSIDSASFEFKTLADLFASHLLNNNGHITAYDYNFNADRYNNCKVITGYVNKTKLPSLYKEALKRYYSEVIIHEGNKKNTGEEMNWLNWIPSGGVVVFVQAENTKTSLKGVIFTKHTLLTEIISAVYPKFINFSDEAKERALIFISKMNPYVKVSYNNARSSEGNKKNVANVSYTAEKGQFILIPALKFISE